MSQQKLLLLDEKGNRKIAQNTHDTTLSIELRIFSCKWKHQLRILPSDPGKNPSKMHLSINKGESSSRMLGLGKRWRFLFEDGPRPLQTTHEMLIKIAQVTHLHGYRRCVHILKTPQVDGKMLKIFERNGKLRFAFAILCRKDRLRFIFAALHVEINGQARE